MAVDRDRWVGAPIDQHGNARPSAEFWKRLNEAIVSSNLPALRRKVPVRIVTPRTAIRLRRLLNAFGPATAAGFSVMGRPASAHCLDDDFGTGQPLASATERFVDAVEAALEAEQVPFAHVGDDDPTACVTDAAWVVVAAPAGSVDPTLLSMLEAFAADGGRVSFGPCAPSRGPSLREVPVPVFPYGVLTEEGLDEAISRTIEELGLRRLRVTPAQVHATVHEDDDGRARVVFLINAGEADLEASLSLPGQGTVTDACTLEELDWREGRLIATVHARTVRMIRL
jgi:beta-galactosidase